MFVQILGSVREVDGATLGGKASPSDNRNYALFVSCLFYVFNFSHSVFEDMNLVLIVFHGHSRDSSVTRQIV